MPKIAEFAQLPDGRMAVVLETPTTDEGSITIWSEEEVERVKAVAAADEREECAKVAEQFTQTAHVAHDMKQGSFPQQSPMQVAIGAAIRARQD